MAQNDLLDLSVLLILILFCLVPGTFFTSSEAQSPSPAPTGLRAELPLNGMWESAVVPVDTSLNQIAQWQPFPVPQTFRISPRYGAGARACWVRRTIDIPADWTGRRIFLFIGGALYDPQVYIDGQPVPPSNTASSPTGYRDGWSALEVELTSFVQPGRQHVLAIRCRDQSAAWDPSFPVHGIISEEDLRGKVLAPLGGYKEHPGIWDDVKLLARPAVHFSQDDLLVLTSVRNARLQLQGRIDSPRRLASNQLYVTAVVLDGDQTVLESPPAPVAADGTWHIEIPFTNVRLWSPEDPYLYQLRLTLRTTENHQVLDQLDHRLGFREFWYEGPNFYLNGVPIRLRTASQWPAAQPLSRQEIARRLQAYKATHANTFRTHIGGWQKAWYELADEIGMLMIPEAAVYTDGAGMYAYTDVRFWDNYRDHVARLIRYHRNHPSVVIFSLGNETLFMNNARHDPELPKKLGDLARFARPLAPQQLLNYDGDWDPDGAYDIINLHYPHEMPENYAYPNVADWLDKVKETEAGGGMLGQVRGHFFWQRNKPLFVGEYLWVPHEDFSVASIWFGDQAYLNRAYYRRAAQLAAVWDQTLAYRRAGVSGFCPWIGAAEHKEFFRPVAAFLYNRDSRCFAGDTYTFAFDVFNDSLQPHQLLLSLRETQDRVPALQETLFLNPAEYRRVNLTIQAPVVEALTTLNFQMLLTSNGQEMHRTQHELTVWPRLSNDGLIPPPGWNLLVIDPTGTWPGASSSSDVLRQADPDNTLVILAPGALDIPSEGNWPVVGRHPFDAQPFLEFLQRGGRALVLEQNSLLPLRLGLELQEHASTMTFPVVEHHPILTGLKPGDLKYWRGDHYVSRKEIRRPDHSGAQAIVVSGGPRSVNQAPILEMPVGRGRLLLIQALVGAKRHLEPAAAVLLHNALQYLAQRTTDTAPAKAILLNQDPAFQETLQHIGSDFHLREEPLSQADLSDPRFDPARTLIILHGNDPRIIPSAPALAAFLQRQGTIYWHQPDAETFQAVAPLLGLEGWQIHSLNLASPIRLREDPLLRSVLREDLTHMAPTVGWDRQTALWPNADRVFLPADVLGDAPAQAVTLQPSWTGRQQSDGSILFDNQPGTATARLNVEQPGLYRLVLRAAQAQPQKTPPQVNIFLNERFVFSLYPDSAESKEYTALLELQAGENLLFLAIGPHGPRSDPWKLAIQELRLEGPLSWPENADALTLPPTLLRIRPAQGGQLILDATLLPQEGPNALKSRRYLSSLLANLPVSFRISLKPHISTLPLNRFQALTGTAPLVEIQPDRISLRINATVQADFLCRSAGRYSLQLRGSSTPLENVYGQVRIELDDRDLGQVELKSRTPALFEVGEVTLSAGRHTLKLSFINDAANGREDRNVFLDEVLFVQR